MGGSEGRREEALRRETSCRRHSRSAPELILYVLPSWRSCPGKSFPRRESDSPYILPSRVPTTRNTLASSRDPCESCVFLAYSFTAPKLDCSIGHGAESAAPTLHTKRLEIPWDVRGRTGRRVENRRGSSAFLHGRL